MPFDYHGDNSAQISFSVFLADVCRLGKVALRCVVFDEVDKCFLFMNHGSTTFRSKISTDYHGDNFKFLRLDTIIKPAHLLYGCNDVIVRMRMQLAQKGL